MVGQTYFLHQDEEDDDGPNGDHDESTSSFSAVGVDGQVLMKARVKC